MSTEATADHPRIVVGVDGSEQSKVALQWAATLARAIGASIDAVAVWQMPPAYDWSMAAQEWDPAQDTEKKLAAAVDQVFLAQRPARLRLLVRQGNTVQELLSSSEGATMLVLGSRGRGGFKTLLLGSVSATCAEHAHCPVLVVHGPQPPTRFTPAAPAAGD